MDHLKKFISAAVAAAIACASFAGCGNADKDKKDSSKKDPAAAVSAVESNAESDNSGTGAKDYSNVDLADYEDTSFVITLYADKAPVSCENFEKLINEGFYDGLIFHRVVEDFMAQGGDPLGNGTGGSEETIKGEFSSNGVDNDLSHTRGIVSMARSNDPDSASSQFFICYSDEDTFLDGNYAAFGEVTEGMDVVDDFLKISRTVGGDNALSSPVSPITIVKAVMIDDDDKGNHRAKFYMDFLQHESEELQFTITLRADQAPLTCETFELMVASGYYNGKELGTIFKDQVAMCYSPYYQYPQVGLKGEFSENGVDNGLSHKPGVLTMAREDETSYDNATGDFMICLGDMSETYDGKMAAFAEITEGAEVLEKLNGAETISLYDGMLSVPLTIIKIKSVEMTDDDADGNHRAIITLEY